MIETKEELKQELQDWEDMLDNANRYIKLVRKTLREQINRVKIALGDHSWFTLEVEEE